MEEKFKNTNAKNNYAELFKIGKTYEFYIVSEEKTPNGKGLFHLISKDYGTCHKFVFSGEHPSSPGEMIKLKVRTLNEYGQLMLTNTDFLFAEEELNLLKKVDDITFEREGQHLEFKSSMVYTQEGIINIDAQLGCEIISAVAAMLNTDGGEVRIGYNNEGKVVGINKDVEFINFSKYDKFNYPKNFDGIELKIRNIIKEKMGEYAASLVKIDFCRTYEGLVVAVITAKPSLMPIFVSGSKLYVRCGNMTSRLQGPEITTFICDKMKIKNEENYETKAITENETVKTIETIKETEMEKNNVEIKADHYITLYRNGEASTQTCAINASAVLFNIPLTFAQIHNPKTRLVMTYENGHCSFFKPFDILKMKLRNKGENYMNGWNKNSRIVDVLVCNEDDYLAVRSRRLLDDEEMVKAVAVSKYRTLDGRSMHAQGVKIVDNCLAKSVDYTVVPNANFDKIEKIFMKSGYTFGYPVNSNRAANFISNYR